MSHLQCAALRLLAKLIEQGVLVHQTEKAQAVSNGIEVEVKVKPVASEPPPAAPLPHLTPLQHKILTIVTDIPMPPKRIARLAGVAYNSWFRTALSHLIDAGLVVRVRGGIRRGK